MSITARRLFALHVIMTVLLAACGLGASPEPLPTEVVAAATATHTEAPTATEPPPTATITPSPVPPTDTPTPVPPTKTPRPTATPTPGPGDIVYYPEFVTDWKAWGDIYFGTDRYTVEPDGPSLTINIDGVDTYVYHVYDGDFNAADVQIDTDVTVVSGPNSNNLSIICRFSELGWYEFNIESGGLWTIFKYDDTNGYRQLSSGGSTAIHMNNALNHLTAECVGDTLTFYINDVKVGSAKDGAYADGTFGMSASTFEIGKLKVRFDDFTVRLADPEADLGAAVAPTVPPGFGSGGTNADATWTAYFAGVPVPGGTLANNALQFGVMLDVGMAAVGGIPASCGQVAITNTAVVQVVRPFVFNDQQNLVDGEWLELWTLTACGVASNYQVRYTANGDGIVYVVTRQ